MGDHAEETEQQKGKPGAWDPEEDRKRIYKKAAEVRKDPYEENRTRFFGSGTEDEEIRDLEWKERSESSEMVEAVKKFLKVNGLTEKDPLWKKINDYKFYGQHADILEAHERGDFDTMLRLAKSKAEREMEHEGRRRYVEARQREQRPGGESFEAYQKRMRAGGR
jgi:hypothetical protein